MANDIIGMCALCGMKLPEPQLEVELIDEKVILTCPRCSAQYGLCTTCQNSQGCLMQENPDNIQPYIMETVRQGNMVMQQQKINPELIEKTCAAGCKCWNATERFCNREANCCINFNYILKKED